MSTATKAWNRTWKRDERRLLEVVIDKLLTARLAYTGRDSMEQRANTRTWAKVLIEAFIEDQDAALLFSKVTIQQWPLVVEVPNETKTLIADIRHRLPLVAIGHPDLAAAIAGAMDEVEAGAPK